MPNTLVHMGAQGLLTRSVLRDADLKWVYIGGIIPDLPWILQRIVRYGFPQVDVYALRYYAYVQAALFTCLLLAAALALLTSNFRRTFLLLGINVLLHLVLDASQIKWANGVHLWAPFSWELVSWGFFWPESLLNYLLTGGSLLYVLGTWRPTFQKPLDFIRPSTPRLAGVLVLMIAYVTLPFVFLHGPKAANNHFVETLRTPHDRPGQYVEFDREHCVPLEAADACLLDGTIRAEGMDLQQPAKVSLRGVFVDEHAVRVLESHVHNPWFRDAATYLGLSLILALWVLALGRRWLPRHAGEKA